MTSLTSTIVLAGLPAILALSLMAPTAAANPAERAVLAAPPGYQEIPEMAKHGARGFRQPATKARSERRIVIDRLEDSAATARCTDFTSTLPVLPGTSLKAKNIKIGERDACSFTLVPKAKGKQPQVTVFHSLNSHLRIVCIHEEGDDDADRTCVKVASDVAAKVRENAAPQQAKKPKTKTHSPASR